eukprot:5602584-Pyramimonas_sp.AAC.1
MGWRLAMGLFQCLHRRMQLAGGASPTGLPPCRELRKDRPMPPLSSSCHALRGIWQIYCDDADYGRL